ncbi:MAG TPA: hypothetical protein GXX18_00905 [Bacillales bacterium]|nr:hypothetical protein [Bacillales bacterium]
MNRQNLIDRVNYITGLFVSNERLFNTSLVPEIKVRGISKVVATLPLQTHDVYGKTILYINELINLDGSIKEYRYGWELISTPQNKLSKQARHIWAFDKQTHPEPPHQVDSDPFHHHHVPRDMTKRKTTNVQCLEDVLSILNDYIVGNLEYDENHSF